ncbi:MAG: hypothetical protein AB7U73_15915 [Pirellulales bacterium]
MIRKLLSSLLVFYVAAGAWPGAVKADIQSLNLNAVADDSSSFYEYWSDGFSRIDLRDPPPNEFRQRMHNITDPAIFYGALDTFPHDELMQFGSLEYDDSTLISGTGLATITGVTLGVYADPSDPSYQNFARFSLATDVTSVAGNSSATPSIRFYNNVPVAIDLNAGVKLYGANILGSTIVGEYFGSFAVERTIFSLLVEGQPFIDPIFQPEGTEFHMKWDFTGFLSALAVPGDADNNRIVDGDDYIAWADNFNQATPDGPFGGDFDFNGIVNGDDYIVWADNFAPETLITSVPEPSTWWLAVLSTSGLAAMTIGRRAGARLRRPTSGSALAATAR